MRTNQAIEAVTIHAEIARSVFRSNTAECAYIESSSICPVSHAQRSYERLGRASFC